MSTSFYHPFFEHLAEGNVGDLRSVTVKSMIVSTAYTFDPDHEFVSDVVAAEPSGTGYAGGFAGAGRLVISSITVVRDNTNNWCVIDGADPSWPGINLAATQIGGIILWLPKTSDADSPLICYDGAAAGGFPVTTSGGTYTHAWSASGIGRFKLP